MTGTPSVVGDVMTRTVVALQRGAAFKDIVKTMRRQRVGAAPVLDDDGHVILDPDLPDAGATPRTRTAQGGARP
ncbi:MULTISPECIES: CBS domain-containing protein [unclassified Streptomyces]|uniref:CBS domain-containing protein n=1 Tax=unclassified Streptomyces TaxID=2593676 RepID=UPI003414FFAF